MSDQKTKFEPDWLGSIGSDRDVFLQNLHAIKQFAYEAFDKLDGDKNGYLDREELIGALVSDKTSASERDFITFLLNNQEQISEAFDEQDPTNTRHGISRADLDCYFKMITELF